MKLALINYDYFFLLSLNISLRNDILKEEVLENSDSKTPNSLILKYRSTWADNGDNISLIYANSIAATTTMTKTGNKGFSHKINKA